ncbi:MAG: DUF2283 domain-containing protein [Nitrospinae bacterium]|nr:DUF2283 domain-containing protein [Nitrospinota bacterium]
MKLTYDSRYNVAYLKFHDKADNVETVQVSADINVDIDSDGRVYGIELLNANDQLLMEDGGKLVIVNEAGGKRKEVTLER